MGAAEREKAPAVTKYLAKVSTLTAPETEGDMKDISLRAAAEESDAMVGLLKKRLSEKTKYEVVLQQGLRSAKASEDVLQSQLASERRSREQLQKEILDMKSNLDSLKLAYTDVGKKEVIQAKETNRLDLQVKDLQMTLEQTIDKEKKAEISLVGAGRKSRELERELISVRIANTRLNEINDAKDQEMLELEDSLQTQRDKLTREANVAKVKVIALKKTKEETSADIVRLNEEITEAEASLIRMRDTQRLEMELAEVAKKVLQKRLLEEEGANKQLCEELGKKAKIEMQLMTDLRTAESARKMLTAQLEEKMKLSLELSNRLSQLQSHTQVLEERLGDKNIQAETLTKNLEMIKSDVKVLQLQLTKEQHSMMEAGRSLKKQQESVSSLGKEITERVDADQAMTLRVKQIEADAAILNEDVDTKLKEEAKAKESLSQARNKSEMLTQQMEDVQSTLTDMKERYELKCVEHDNVQKHLKTKTKALMYEEHMAKLKLNELENSLRDRTDLIVQIKNGLMLNDVKIKDLSEMLQSASEAAEQNKQNLMGRVSEITNANKLLEDEIKQERSRGALLETDLVNVESRLRISLAQLSAQERTAEGLSEVNAQDQELIMKRLQEQTEKVERLNAQRAQVLADIRVWETKLEDELLEKDRAMKHLKVEKSLVDKLREQVETHIDLELEQKSRIKMLEQHNQGLDADVEEKTKLEGAARIELDEFTSQVDIMTQELREQELKNEELVGVQIANRGRIAALEINLTQQEQQHLADARAVKLSIISLQDALMDKVNSVEQLVKITQTTKSKAKELQTRLRATEGSADDSQARYEKMLQEEQRLSATLRGELENRRRQHAVVTNSIERKSDKIQSLAMTLTESSNRGEILKSDADTKRKEAEMMAEQLEKKASRERDMVEAIQVREEQIGVMVLAGRERAKRESELQKNLKQARFENRLLKNQVQEKMKAERYLLAELEAQRLHVQENKHPESYAAVKDQMKQNRELSSVLKSSGSR